MFALAKETGWPEYFILWELPLSRLLQYQHCSLRANDVWTVATGAPPSEVSDEFDRAVNLTEGLLQDG